MSAHGGNDISPAMLIQCFQAWRLMDEQLKHIQEQKKLIIAGLRNSHGKLVAEGVKQCMNYMLKDPRQRHEAVMYAREARRYVEILEDQGVM